MSWSHHIATYTSARITPLQHPCGGRGLRAPVCVCVLLPIYFDSKQTRRTEAVNTQTSIFVYRSYQDYH